MMEFRLSQLINGFVPMDATLSGIVIEVRDKQ